MPMKILVLGGNRFIGRGLALRLAFAGHDVTVCNRGTLPAPPGARAIHADRTSDAFARAIAGSRFDCAVDFAGYTADDTRHVIRALDGVVPHYVFISTGQVYLVREGLSGAARETDYAGPVMAAPPTPAEEPDWAYGVGKRGAEEVVAAAPFATLRLRIPMVSGEGDPKRRFEAYLWPMLDRTPLAIPRPDAIARHVYAGSVVDALVHAITGRVTGAFNYAQDEEPTVGELVTLIGHAAGCHDVRIVDGDGVSPFSTRWMSRLDPGAARAAGFPVHVPLADYVRSTVRHILAQPQPKPSSLPP